MLKIRRERQVKTLWEVRKPFNTENAINGKWKCKRKRLTGDQVWKLLEAGYDLMPV